MKRERKRVPAAVFTNLNQSLYDPLESHVSFRMWKEQSQMPLWGHSASAAPLCGDAGTQVGDSRSDRVQSRRSESLCFSASETPNAGPNEARERILFSVCASEPTVSTPHGRCFSITHCLARPLSLSLSHTYTHTKKQTLLL